MAEHLAASDHWDVVGVSRRPPAAAGYRAIAVDLTDPDACRTALGELTNVTDLIYCARYTHATFVTESADINGTMFRNLLSSMTGIAQGLKHVHAMQGTKYYGSDLGPFKTPAKETDPRVLNSIYYYQQQDFLEERSRSASWTWSSSLPHCVCDYAPGFPRMLPMVIAVYAAISKELGLPLCFPGTQGNFNAIYQCTDTTLLANAVAWMATSPRCAGQRFNITNGDYIRWTNLWPAFAKFFEMEPGPVRTIRLAEIMADKGEVWERLVKRHGLLPTPFEDAALWSYGDFIFTPDYDMMSETRKLREYGFPETMDTEAMFLGIFAYLRKIRFIP